MKLTGFDLAMRCVHARADRREQVLQRRIVSEAAKTDYKFSSIILGIIKSEAFQMNMKPEGESLASR